MSGDVVALTSRQLVVLAELEAAPRVAKTGHVRRTLTSLEDALLAKSYRSAKGDIYRISAAGKGALKVKKRRMVRWKGTQSLKPPH